MIARPPRTYLMVICLLIVIGTACTPRPLESIPEAPPPASTTELTGTEGQSYSLHLPDGRRPPNGWPLVIALHGIRSGAGQMEELTGFSELADDERFAVAYADAGDGLWLDVDDGLFGEGGVATESDVDFITELVDMLVADRGIDPERVYASGFSNGALFAVQLACTFPDMFAAIGVVGAAGTVGTLEHCELDRPVGFIAFHGTTDSIVPFDGGKLVDAIPGIVELAGAEETAAFWASELDCPAEPARRLIESDPDYPVLRTRYAPCDAGTAVELYAIKDGGHGWPGGNNDASATATTSADINASETIWRFFEQQGGRSDTERVVDTLGYVVRDETGAHRRPPQPG